MTDRDLQMSESVNPVAGGSAVPETGTALQMSVDADPVAGGSAVPEPGTALHPVLCVPSFREFIPVPLAKAGKTTSTSRKRRVGHACILTKSPYKRQLMESKQIKTDAHQKKEQRAKKKLEKEINKQIKLQQNGNGPKPTSRWGDPTSGSSKRKSGPRKKKSVSAQSDKRKRSTRPKMSSSKKAENDDCECLYCGGLYSESTEDFIQCQGGCEKWAHIGCTDIDVHGQYTREHCC